MLTVNARRSLFLLISLAVILLDRVAKIAVARSLDLHASTTVISGFFKLVHVRNRGAAFGIFNDHPAAWKTGLLIAFSFLALAVVLGLLWKNARSFSASTVGLSLILGGAIGNLWDRITHGYVIDFLLFYYRQYEWPAFNVADSCIVIGAILLASDVVFGSQRKPEA
jgi:signal peptidase II